VELELTMVQRRAAETQIFLLYISAVMNQNDKFIGFLKNRFPPHLLRALDTWWALDPLHNPSAPVSPLYMKEYIPPEKADALKYSIKAQTAKLKALNAGKNSTDYMLVSLVLSMVLFFSGLSGTINSYTSQKILIGIAAMIFLAVLVTLLNLPIIK
jgi:hypothetical protein